MALGSVGLGLLIISLGIAFVLTVPCSVAGWVLAAKGRGRVQRGETSRHAGAARAGVVLGIAGTVLGLVAGAIWVVFAWEAINDPLAPWNP